MLEPVVISGDDVCCSVVFGTLVGVFVFSVMWSELLMTSGISYPLWSSVHECQRVECALMIGLRLFVHVHPLILVYYVFPHLVKCVLNHSLNDHLYLLL